MQEKTALFFYKICTNCKCVFFVHKFISVCDLIILFPNPWSRHLVFLVLVYYLRKKSFLFFIWIVHMQNPCLSKYFTFHCIIITFWNKPHFRGSAVTVIVISIYRYYNFNLDIISDPPRKGQINSSRRRNVIIHSNLIV